MVEFTLVRIIYPEGTTFAEKVMEKAVLTGEHRGKEASYHMVLHPSICQFLVGLTSLLVSETWGYEACKGRPTEP